MYRQWISLLLSICLLFSIMPAFAARAVQTPGDIDGNGTVDAADVQAFADALSQGKAPAKAVSDVTQDGYTGIDDLQALAQHMSGSSRTARILSENGFTGSVYIGIAARLEVSEHFMPFLVGSGSARVTNPALSYDSGDLPLSFETSGRALYCHFETAGLTPSDEYAVRFTLFDRDGHEIPSAMPDQKMTLAVSPALRQMTLASSVDTQITSPTLSMDFSRLYCYDAVQASHLGDMGYGWSHSFDTYVLEYTDGLTGVHMASGEARWFRTSRAGIYDPCYGDTGVLTRDADGKYRLREENGSMYGFYKDGSLQFIMSPNRETIYLYRNAKKQISKAELSFNKAAILFKYNDNGRIATMTDQYGRTTRYAYDSTGTLLTSVTAADGSTTRYTYVTGGSECANNLLASIETAGGVFTHFFYDDQGRLTGTTGTWGANPVRYDYDDATGDVRVTDAAGMAQVFRRDGETGALSLEIGDYPLKVSNGTLLGKLNVETDASGRLKSISDLDGNALVFTWDDNVGKITAVTDPTGNTLRAEYDDRRNPVCITYPDGSTASAEYTRQGLMTAFTDAKGNKTEFSYTPAGQIRSITNPEGLTSTVSYDKYGSVSKIADAGGNATVYQRDLLGRISQVTYPDKTKEAYTYRADGYLLSRTDASGNRTDYTYDITGRLESCVFADGTSLNYTYDARGKLSSAVRRDADGKETASETFVYDERGFVASTAHSTGGVSSFDVSVYSREMDRAGYGYSDGYGVNYEYDASGRMTRIFDGGGTIAEYEYDKNGRVSTRRLGNGTYTLYERDAMGNITSISEYDAQGVLRDQALYMYDANGNCLSEVTPFGENAYMYDSADRLTEATYRNGSTEAFTYDASGNIISRTLGDRKDDAEISNMNRVVRSGGREYQWDANGQLTRITENGSVTELTWNMEGRLTAVTRDGEQVTYGYDALGRLNSRTTAENTVYYEWDYVTGNLTALKDVNGTVILKYVYGPDTKEPLAALWDTGRTYFRQDRNYSIVGATDADGNYTDRQLYSAYGEVLYGGRLCDFSYAAMLQDEATGLLYAGERWYDPQTGNFISPDKESLWDGLLNVPSDPRESAQNRTTSLTAFAGNGNMLNRYAYANWNPLKYWDPDGKKAVRLSGGVGITVGGTGSTTVSISADIGPDGDTTVGRTGSGPSSGSGIQVKVAKSKDEPNIGGGVGSGTGGTGGWGGSGGSFGGSSSGGCCPTFIQIEPGRRLSAELPPDASDGSLTARITVPVDGAYLRSDIPIFGVAGGNGFDHYTVEYASAASPEEWILIESSETPQNQTDVSAADIWAMQGDIDIRGNLATWNTGLKNWEHLPWHPADEDIDILGEYTIRLTAYGADGAAVQDSVSVVVGDVAAQSVGGRVRSTDGLFELDIEPLSLSAPFRVFAAKPAEAAAGSDRILSALYDVSPYDEPFMQNIKAGFVTDNADCAVVLYDAGSGEITQLDTFRTETGVAAYIDRLPGKGVYFALAASDAPAGEAPAPTAAQQPLSDTVYCHMTFDGDCGSFESADGASGADVYSENGYLVLENRTFGGTFGASCVQGPVDAARYPVLTFDYCVLPGVRLDLYLLVNGRWYNINFTDDPQGFKNTDVNIASAGKVSGVIADGEWHTAAVRLDKALALATRNTVIDGIYFRDLDVTGYMKLDTGSNSASAKLLIDNFLITALPDSAKDGILIDAFASGSRNLLGGSTGVYCGEDDVCSMSAESGELRFTWDTGNDGGYAGYWSDLEGLSLEGVSALKIDFLGDIPEGLRCGLRCGSKETSVPASERAELLENGGRTVVIPLSELGFTGRDSADVVFLSTVGKGEVSISRIALLTGESSESDDAGAPVSVFDENRWSSFRDGAGAISFGRTGESGDDAACRISYGGSIGKSYGGRIFSYAGWTQEMTPLDARDYEYLVLSIRGEQGGEKPNVYLDDGTTRKCVLAKDMAAVTADDSMIRIPLSEFASKGIDLSHVAAVQIVFEWEEMSGTVYISDIAFE